MSIFVLLVATLMVAVVVGVCVPLLRARGAGEPPARWAALGAAALLVFGGSLLYVTWSNWKWHVAEADSPQTMVARLARQLERDPGNLDGWLMLGRSYLVLQEYPLALRAFERADRMAKGTNVEALLGEAEALALSDESELAGRAGKLFEQALALAPDSGKALFFGGMAAERRGDLKLARERFAKLLSLNPPDSVRPMIEQQISALDEKLAAAPGVSPGADASPGAAAADANAAVRVNVTLGARLAAGAPGPLFVFVRRHGEGGPPLAAKRLDGHFPQSVVLTPADAMIPGRTFSAGQEVEVVARVARSGSPLGAKGDPVGQVSYRVGKDGVVNLVIDQLTP